MYINIYIYINHFISYLSFIYIYICMYIYIYTYIYIYIVIVCDHEITHTSYAICCGKFI